MYCAMIFGILFIMALIYNEVWLVVLTSNDSWLLYCAQSYAHTIVLYQYLCTFVS